MSEDDKKSRKNKPLKDPSDQPIPMRRKFRHEIRMERNYEILREEFGQERSIKEWDCIDADGEVIPWYPYPAIDFLKLHDFSDASILEYGSGNSTLWWLKRAKNVVAIDNNLTWYNKTRKRLFGNEPLQYHLVDNMMDYAARPEVFDANIIIIDGVWRREVVAYLMHHWDRLKETLQLLIFDNSDWYPDNMARLADTIGWPQNDYMGFGPINDHCWTASFFQNPDKPFKRIHALNPIGSIPVRKNEDQLVQWDDVLADNPET